jgi:hypothetical protein
VTDGWIVTCNKLIEVPKKRPGCLGTPINKSILKNALLHDLYTMSLILVVNLITIYVVKKNSHQ